MSRSLNEMKIREALRLKAAGLNNTQISESSTVGAARSTIVELFKRCELAGIDAEQAAEMSDSELRALLYPRNLRSGRARQELNEERWYQKILNGKDRQGCWEEYISEEPDGMSYGQFCRRIKQFSREKGDGLSYAKQMKAGEVMETDWAGETLDIVYDPTTDTFLTAHIFVSTLGFSGKIFCRAYLNEREEAWIDAHSRALEYYGGLPRIVTPDNTKTAITKTNRYEPTKNPNFMLWAQHYGLAIIPARISKPTDKNLVEGGVGYVERRVLSKLKGQIFFSFDSLNQELGRLVEILNNRPYQKRPGSRLEVFAEIDQPHLRPLPLHRFELPQVKWATVSRNGYHVSFDGRLYSTPYQFCGKKVLVSSTGTTVEILYDNRRIAFHQRCYDPAIRCITIKDHMPQRHQHQYMADSMNGRKYRNWAETVGPFTYKFISALLERYEIEEQTYQSCMGILRLADKYSNPLLEEACRIACEIGMGGYTQIKTILTKIEQKQKQEKLNKHENIRGASYYAKGNIDAIQSNVRTVD